MDELTLNHKAAAIADDLADLTPGYAVKVLHRAQGRVLSSIPEVELNNLTVLPAINPAFLDRRPGRFSKIEDDPVIQKFVNKHLNRTYNEIRRRCLARFGPTRAPSKTTIGRYVQKLRAERQKEKSCDTPN